MQSIQYTNISRRSEKIIESMNHIAKRTGKKLGDFSLNKRGDFSIPHFINKSYDVEKIIVNDHSAVTIKSEEIVSNKHIIYFHGGAYVVKGKKLHWKLLDEILTRNKGKATYIDYPLAPEYSYLETHEMVNLAYEDIIKRYPNDDFIFMGDSAGGGLALAFAQSIYNDENFIKPQRLVLLSPWLDLAMESTSVEPIDKDDFILSREKLFNKAKSYAKGENLKNPLLSPIFGNVKDLCPIDIYVGTYEMMYADCMKISNTEGNDNVTTYVYEKMPHVWILMPLEESKKALESIIESIK